MLSDSTADVTGVLLDEDLLRAQLYRLLARYLTSPPSQTDLDAAASLEADNSPLGKAIQAFARVASQTSPATVDDEYHALFIGVGRGELLPFASYYLTGFLHEKPLARLRNDMAQLGIVADPASSEPEDHAAAILEMMAGLIDGSLADIAPHNRQRHFYDAHVDCWMPLFFRDLAGASSSIFYAVLAQVGSRFLEIERAAFEMDENRLANAATRSNP